MNITEQQISSAIECIQASIGLIRDGKVESVIRHSFTSYLRSIFSDVPSWVEHHIAGGEAAVHFGRDGMTRRGFVDNLLDLIAIEYESDLTNRAKFETGYGQVKDYCASLLNEGNDAELVLGILSDTVRWFAYKIVNVTVPASGILGGNNIELEEIEHIDLTPADETAAHRFIVFLNSYLGRLESRPLNASSIAKDLGFGSRYYDQYTFDLRALVQTAVEEKPEYAELISNLLNFFVGHYDQAIYSDELYLLTLGKLVCANVIAEKALISDDNELELIMNGTFFIHKGFTNLVEYDYFGWLNNEANFLVQLLPIARCIQDDLRAYDFSQLISEDLFGQLMAQLANKSRRLLLGQEWTPKWLARLIVGHVIETLPNGEFPRLIDMCCGSGSMIVETIKMTKDRINDELGNETLERKLNVLSQAITGFDIDPLAVMLAKISWIIAARDCLEPFGTYQINIPIYHADSLFAITPLTEDLGDEGEEDFYRLAIADTEIRLPRFLISSKFQKAFDTMLDSGYHMAMSGLIQPETLNDTAIAEVTRDAFFYIADEVNTEMHENAKLFLKDFILTVARLQREGKNGIWAFILRNSYRPGLVTGQFNGLVSNPPWLALSKIADNPFLAVLKRKAEQFGIKPPGPSFPHIEMATIFLLHAVEHYLSDGAIVGCITPETVLNGYNHEPFRRGKYLDIENPIKFRVDEIWRVQEQTFKNNAIVLFGQKYNEIPHALDTIPGALAQENHMSLLEFHRIVQGRRTAWSEQIQGPNELGFFTPAEFNQGADIMPRTVLFHEREQVPRARGQLQWRVTPIELGTSPFAFIINDVKLLSDFRINSCVLPDDLFFNVLISKLLTPFEIIDPITALLPIRKDEHGIWKTLTPTDIEAKSHTASLAFRQIYEAMGGTDINIIWNKINKLNKLVRQKIEPGGYLVFTGTSGAKVCSAFAETNGFNLDKLIVDQTLNWARVESIEEAIYLVGLFNSEAINLIIQDFQPEGAFGKRHIHSLPFRVTPPFDINQIAHQEVVAKTQQLLVEYSAAKNRDPSLRILLNPNRSTLQKRRLDITAKLRELTSYEEYQTACRNLYGI